MDEEAILGGPRSGEDLPDYNFEEFEVGSAGQDRRSDDPDRDTPRSRGRFTDDGDDRIFRQATDDEQGQKARPDRGGSEPGFRHGHLDFISMAMNMAQVNRRPRMSSGTGREDQEPWFRLREISRVDPLVLKNQVSLMSTLRGRSQASDTRPC